MVRTRICSVASTVLLVVLVSVAAGRAADVACTWKGSDGNWSDPAKWDCDPPCGCAACYPNNGNCGLTFDADIWFGNREKVTFDQDVTVEQLRIGNIYAERESGLTGEFALTANGSVVLGTRLTGLVLNANAGLILWPMATLDHATVNSPDTTWRYGGHLRANHAVFNNTGSFIAEGDNSSGYSYFTNWVFNNFGTFTANATDDTDWVSLFYVTLNNSGTLNVDRGSMQVTQLVSTDGSTVNVRPGTTLRLHYNSFGDHVLHAGSTLNNEGTLMLGGYWGYPPNVRIDGTVVQLSEGTLTGGTWVVGADSTLDITSGEDITTNQATVVLELRGKFDKINALADNQGHLSIQLGKNFTTAGDLTNSGTITVGSADSATGEFASKLNVNGNLTMEHGSRYCIQFCSTGLSTIAAAGDVLLAGSAGQAQQEGSTLVLQPFRSFLSPGESVWPVLTAEGAGGVIGAFSHEPGPGDYLGYGVFCEGVTYVGAPEKVTSVQAGVFQALAGDTDGDGDVDPADLAKLAINWDPAGTERTWPEGNFDDYQDGNVDPADLALLAVNWSPAGYLPEGAAGARANSTAVPEPGTLLMLAAGLIGVALLAWPRLAHWS